MPQRCEFVVGRMLLSLEQLTMAKLVQNLKR
jgi:hypothetical protein